MTLPTTTTKYAIRKKGDDFPVTYTTSSNEGDYCVSTEYILSTKEYYGETTWYAETREQAQRVLENPTDWYNAGYETPNHDLDPKDYEIVQVMMTISKV